MGKCQVHRTYTRPVAGVRGKGTAAGMRQERWRGFLDMGVDSVLGAEEPLKDFK